MADYQVKILPLGKYEVLYGFLISLVVGKTGEQDGSRRRRIKMKKEKKVKEEERMKKDFLPSTIRLLS